MRTNSEIACWMRCPQEHEYRYVQLRRSAKDAAVLSFGKLTHTALETGVVGVGDPYDVARLNAMLLGYQARWVQPLEILRREYQWEKQGFSGKVDGIMRRDGRIQLLEYKTSSEDITPGSSYWARVGGALDAQVSMYLWGLRGSEYETDTCLYDVLKKPAIRPKVKESPAEFYERCLEEITKAPEKHFQRASVVRTSEELDRVEEELMQKAEFMAWAASKEYHPKNTANCMRWGRECTYMKVCEGQTTIQNDLLFRTAAAPHEELVRAAERG